MESEKNNIIEIKCYELQLIKELKKNYDKIKSDLVKEIYDELIPDNNCLKYDTWETCIDAMKNKGIIYNSLGLKEESKEIIKNMISVLDSYGFHKKNSINYHPSRYCYLSKMGIYFGLETAQKQFTENCLKKDPAI